MSNETILREIDELELIISGLQEDIALIEAKIFKLSGKLELFPQSSYRVKIKMI